LAQNATLSAWPNISYDDNQCEQFSKHELQMSHQLGRIIANGGNNCNEKEREEIVASQTTAGSHPYQKQKRLETMGQMIEGLLRCAFQGNKIERRSCVRMEDSNFRAKNQVNVRDIHKAGEKNGIGQ
jgi:hypothetical protein